MKLKLDENLGGRDVLSQAAQNVGLHPCHAEQSHRTVSLWNLRLLPVSGPN
jgi:hypothetical protein